MLNISSSRFLSFINREVSRRSTVRGVLRLSRRSSIRQMQAWVFWLLAPKATCAGSRPLGLTRQNAGPVDCLSSWEISHTKGECRYKSIRPIYDSYEGYVCRYHCGRGLIPHRQWRLRIDRDRVKTCLGIVKCLTV